jgi:hypothetical protein
VSSFKIFFGLDPRLPRLARSSRRTQAQTDILILIYFVFVLVNNIEHSTWVTSLQPHQSLVKFQRRVLDLWVRSGRPQPDSGDLCQTNQNLNEGLMKSFCKWTYHQKERNTFGALIARKNGILFVIR